jgi:hydroxyacyl-ACP dehydratase HTD2-like protein with hotdog domain
LVIFIKIYYKGSTKEWCTENSQVQSFRKSLEKAKELNQDKNTENKLFLPPIYVTNEVWKGKEIIFIAVHAQFGDVNLKSTVKAEPSMTADEFVIDFIKKNASSYNLDENPEKW